MEPIESQAPRTEPEDDSDPSPAAQAERPTPDAATPPAEPAPEVSDDNPSQGEPVDAEQAESAEEPETEAPADEPVPEAEAADSVDEVAEGPEADAPADAANEVAEPEAEAPADAAGEAAAEEAELEAAEGPGDAVGDEPLAESELAEVSVELSEELVLEYSPEELLGAPSETAETSDPGDAQVKAMLEALVYITEEPLTIDQIATALGEPKDRVLRLLEELIEAYSKPQHGLTIREVAGGFKMGTKPEHHEAIRQFVRNLKPPLKLSLAALETLAVIAYKQPITSPEIMEIRGVQGTGVLKTLLDRKLIATAGRKNVIGKPMLYKTTRDFLVQFGLKDLSELPTLKEFEELRRLAIADEPVLGLETPEEASEGEAKPESEPPAAEAPAPAETESETSTPEAAPEEPTAAGPEPAGE